MHSQMHWDGYSLPASQLPYAIPAQPLPPYVYTDGIGMGVDSALQVTWQDVVVAFSCLLEKSQQQCYLGCMEQLLKLLAACGVVKSAAVLGCQVAHPAKVQVLRV